MRPGEKRERERGAFVWNSQFVYRASLARTFGPTSGEKQRKQARRRERVGGREARGRFVSMRTKRT